MGWHWDTFYEILEKEIVEDRKDERGPTRERHFSRSKFSRSKMDPLYLDDENETLEEVSREIKEKTNETSKESNKDNDTVKLENPKERGNIFSKLRKIRKRTMDPNVEENTKNTKKHKKHKKTQKT